MEKKSKEELKQEKNKLIESFKESVSSKIQDLTGVQTEISFSGYESCRIKPRDTDSSVSVSYEDGKYKVSTTSYGEVEPDSAEARALMLQYQLLSHRGLIDFLKTSLNDAQQKMGSLEKEYYGE